MGTHDLDDPERAMEIDLVGAVVAAAAQSHEPLDAQALDAALGLTGDPDAAAPDSADEPRPHPT
ncbi:hypothetical protein [Phycicoccus elongatus]|uniref:hypothetical protein n=1 Tax=Phycicoccus elongatus TaxID=101689 RepID=UPI003783EB19